MKLAGFAVFWHLLHLPFHLDRLGDGNFGGDPDDFLYRAGKMEIKERTFCMQNIPDISVARGDITSPPPVFINSDRNPDRNRFHSAPPSLNFRGP